MKAWLLLVVFWWPAWVLAQVGPDERILWQLFHAQKYRLLKQAIAEYRKRYPNWQPPAALARLLAPGRRRPEPWQAELEQALRTSDSSRLIRLARRYPQAFTCRRADALLALARAYARSGEEQAALLWYRKALNCPDTQVEPMLAEALWQLSPQAFARLLAQSAPRLSPLAYNQLAYQHARRQAFSALQQLKPKLTVTQSLLRQAVAQRDKDLIQAVAWALHQQGELAKAHAWFEAGLKLAPDDQNLAAGLLQNLIRLRQDRAVWELGTRYPGLRQTAGSYLLERAWENYRQGDYPASQTLAEQAATWLESEDAQSLLGWLAFRRGEYQKAQRIFAALFQARPERQDYARALVASHLQAGEDPQRLAGHLGHPALLAELAPQLARQAFTRKQFLRAYALDPEAFPKLKRLAAPSWALGGMTRFKSGTAGLDRLKLSAIPWYEGSYVVTTHRLALNVARLELASDRLKPAGLRTLQASDQPLNQAQTAALKQEALRLNRHPPPHAVEAAWLELSYRQEGKLNPYLSLGLTPLGGQLPPRPTARIKIGDVVDGASWQLHWEAEAFRQPVRQSLLSYTGWELFGKRWGQVLRSGLKLSSLGLIGPFALYQSVEGAFVDGRRTKDNWMIGYHLAAGYDLAWPGFDYLSFGPYFHFLHYANNQNHFRPGYGGYFSPQAFYAGGIQLALRTEEGRRFLLESRLGLGVQHFLEETASWFTRGCNGSLCGLQFPANRQTSFAPSGELRFGFRLHPHLQLIGGVYARQTQGWREAGGGLLVRVSFEPGASVFSADLPEALFAALE